MKNLFQKEGILSSLKLMGVALFLSLLAHSIVLFRFFKDGTLFTGKGDGIAQMIPFQMYLYDKFSHLHFFYDMDFGIGGDFFRSLSYYYSTAPLAYLNFILVWLGDLFLPFNTGDPVFWAKNQIFISIIKLTIIFIVTYKLLRYLNLNKLSSITGSFIYGWSTAYFFFTFTWSFFSDVMIWLPITIYGLERFFHEKKIGLFILGITLTLHSNFYFSYYEFVFVLFYFLYRVIYYKQTDIVNRLQKIVLLTVGAVLGMGVAAVGIVTGISSYLMNDRTLTPQQIKPFIDMVGFYNLFYDGYYLVICFITVLALMSFKLYKHYMYRLFAALSLIFMVCSLSPLFDSFFNGFSIDQRRWIYLLVFVSAMLIAHYLHHLNAVDLKSFLTSVIPLLIIYPLSAYGHEKVLTWLIFIPIICILIFIYIRTHDNYVYIGLHATTIIMTLVFVQDYVTQQIDTLHPFQERNIEFLNSENYNSPTQKQMIKEVQKTIPSSDRIEWQTSATHNTPMYQKYNGIKLYSSIFDKDILKFYDQDLNATMPTDSNSIYYGLGERANLYSLFNVNTSIRLNDSATIPFGYNANEVFTEPNGTQQYKVYKNQNPLPFVRVTNRVYNANTLKTPIDREHAMLDGIILEQEGQAILTPQENLLNKAEHTLENATLKNGVLHVNAENGGPRYNFKEKDIKDYKEMYITLSIESKTATDYHFVWINEIYQSRKPLNDDYRRFNPIITMKVKTNKNIDIKLKPGEYTYTIHGIYGEDYKALEKASRHKNDHKFEKHGDKMKITLGNHDGGYMVVPIPYLNGMKAKVDGKYAEVKEGNYLMTAVKVDKGVKEVEIKYTPPFFHILQIISILSMIAAFFFTKFVYDRRFMRVDRSQTTFEEEDSSLYEECNEYETHKNNQEKNQQ
ncbi:YfhO family protein [Macrococcus sp. EM39E]|uniref:YfhO family protein n=1 Tax=Macrococcus animalis TaxID=3395467 RepID=UPI0039BDB34B